MKTRSAGAFRTWYKIHHKKIASDRSDYDENFMGTYYDVSDEARIKGFFEMFHGHKPDIAGYLPSVLKIAEDGQAIYEFLQNAVDCHSSECHIFYNDRFFLAVNDGRPFTVEEVVSLLNIAQSPKKDASLIGRFGVGFKLIHRLVGQGDGTNELVNEYKGPILFSWSRFEDIKRFLAKELPEYENDFQNDKCPVLFKILLTNFPADMEERVKDVSFNDRIVFSAEELLSMQHFMDEGLSAYVNADGHVFTQGSAFFLQLGKGKKELLDRSYRDLVNGIQFSMNILKLSRICINKREISKFPLLTETFTIDCRSQAYARIDPEYKEFPINVVFGYPADFSQSDALKQSPDFYKYFPMGDEINGFSFIVHCDGFSHEVNRRKLQHDPVNINLLPEIARMLALRMEEYRQSQPERFIAVYGNLLLSDVPGKQNNAWLEPVFYRSLNAYIRRNIPLAGGGWGADPKKVKIKDLKIDIRLGDLGFAGYEWFFWDAKNKDFTEQARDQNKLGLEKWDMRDIAEQSDLDCLNRWIAELRETEYLRFLHELNKDDLRVATKSRLKEMALFKFSDGFHYSVAALSQREDLIFITDDRLVEIKDILHVLGYIATDINVSKYAYLYEAIKESCFPGENKFFDTLAARCKQVRLSPEQKIRLIRNLTNSNFWAEIHDEKLSSLNLFCNKTGEIRPLGALLSPAVPAPAWLDSYKISEEEYISVLDKFLVGPAEVYSGIILPNRERILENIIDQPAFCQELIEFCRQDENVHAWDGIFIDEKVGYVVSDRVFYHPRLADVESHKYAALRTAVFNLTDLYIPERSIVEYLENRPFLLRRIRITECKLNGDAVLARKEVEALLDLCAVTDDSFFDEYIIVKKEGGFSLIPKTSESCQIRIAAACRKFVEDHFCGVYYILPSPFDSYKDSVKGIVEKDELYEDIVSRLDADAYKEEVTRLFLTESAKRLFLRRLRVLSLNVDRSYADGDCEYTILDWACRLLQTNEDIENFRSKITIVSGEGEYRLVDIPPVLDKIPIAGEELSLSRILPRCYKSVDYISMIAENFKSLGDRINTIIGIKVQKTEPEHYYSLLREEELEVCQDNRTRIIDNTEQLIFVLLYQQEAGVVDPFCIYTMEGDEYLYDLGSSGYSLVSYNFLQPQYVIDTVRYENLDRYKELLLRYDYNGTSFCNGPLDRSNTIVCHMISTELDDGQRFSLIEYLYSAFHAGSVGFSWSEEDAIVRILGFDSGKTYYAPAEYIRSEEQLPAYLVRWAAADPTREAFLEALGVGCSGSPQIRLRIALLNDTPFDEQLLPAISVSALEATLAWLRDSKLSLERVNQCALLHRIFDRLENEITIDRRYDLSDEQADELSGRAYEELKADFSYRIFLYDGPLTARVFVGEFGDHMFCEEQRDVVWFEDNSVYINRRADIPGVLSRFVDNNNFPIKFNKLYLAWTESVGGASFRINKEELALINDLRGLPDDEKHTLIRNLRNHIRSPREASQMQQALKRYDRNPGDKSEQFLYDELVARYGASRVKWTSSKNPLNRNREETTDEYDFEVYDETGQSVIYYIDCKSTTQGKLSGTTDIFWTESEWNFLENRQPANYIVARVFDCFAANPQITYLHIECVNLEE